MQVLSWDQEEDVAERSGWEISRICPGNIRFPGSAIWERRPLFAMGSIHQDFTCYGTIACIYQRLSALFSLIHRQET